MCNTWAVGGEAANSSDLTGPQQPEPWTLIDSFPEEVDFIAVFDQPSDQLLSGAGKASRTFVGSMGLFAKTRFAWRALGEILETDSDGVVETLLSGRVVLMVDGLFDGGANPLNLMVTADTNWVVMAEIDEPAMDLIRKKLKPVPRELVGGGIAVYGIEQGRYSLVMLNGDAHNPPRPSRVVLSPKGGRGLLERTLRAVNAPPDPVLDRVVPELADGKVWSMAMRVRVDRVLDSVLDSLTTVEHIDRGIFHIRGLIGGDDGGMEVSFTMPYDEGVLHSRAPVEMLSAMDDRVVCAAVSSSITKMIFDTNNGFSLVMRESQAAQASDADRVLAPVGSLFVFTADDLKQLDDDGPLGLTVLSVFDAGGMNAASADALIEPMLEQRASGGLDAGVGIDLAGGGAWTGGYAGKFPGAVRTHEITDQNGQQTQLAWKASSRNGSSDLILSIGDRPINAGDRVGMLDRASATLDAIGGSPKDNPVVFQGFLRLGELVGALNQVQWMAVGRMGESLGLVSWQVIQDNGALRGRMVFEKAGE